MKKATGLAGKSKKSTAAKKFSDLTGGTIGLERWSLTVEIRSRGGQGLLWKRKKKKEKLEKKTKFLRKVLTKKIFFAIILS
ncbi:hypothetical protein [Victivallis sp. Marseille-Q1083]|uniref:hypothetical protein n=1 Tax=Victivallis sp. Marseille-Q1083 TaxID=2717288 RepID=UPI001588A0D5|nr:hypothetical protein [Victivallis sp. Marseille-Q1083]